MGCARTSALVFCCCLIYGASAGVQDRSAGVSSALKLSMVGTVTTAAGKEFQEGIVRGKNEY